MATGNTTLLGLALPVEGELDGTWGDVVNDSITSLVDSAIAGTTTLSADADVTLTTTNLAANQARQAIILWTASNGATTRNITAPAQSKPYIVINAGTGSIVLRGAGPTTGITIVSGEKCVAAWSGSDFVKVATSTAGTGDVTLNGVQTLTNKNIQSRVVVISDATSITINGDTTDIATQANTQSAGTLTINAPTGTPFNGQKIILRLLSTNVQTFSWNAAFAGSTDVPLPTASTGTSKYDYMGFVYNSTAAKWQIIAKNFGF
jgi:hypothetical protein